MARATLPDGRVLEFPNSMSDAEIRNQIKTMYSQPQQAAPTESEYDLTELPIGEQFKGAAARTTESLKGGMLDVLPAHIASMVGADEYAKQQMEEYKQRMEEAEAEHPTVYKSLSDIKEPGDIFGAGAEALGGALPTAAAALGSAGLGAVAAPMLGLGTAGAGATLGMGAGAIGMNLPESVSSIYEKTGEFHPGISTVIGVAKGLLDTYLPGKILKQLGIKGEDELAMKLIEKSDVVPKLWKRTLAGVARTGAGEGLTEGAQEALDILGEHIAGDKHPALSKENIDRTLMAAFQGTVGGVGLGTPGAMAQARRIQTGVQDKLDAREEAERAAAEGTATPEQKQLLMLPAPQKQLTSDALEAEKAAFYERYPHLHPDYEEPKPFEPFGLLPHKPTRQGRKQPGPELEGMIVGEDGEIFKSEEDKKMHEALKEEEAFYERYPHLHPEYEEPKPYGLLPAPKGRIGRKQPGPELEGMPVGKEGEVFTSPEEAAAFREFQQRRAAGAEQLDTAGLTPAQMEEYGAHKRTAGTPYAQDLFPAEKYLAELREQRGERPGSVEEALAGPAERPAEYSPILDTDTLLQTGLSPKSGLFKKLLDTDVSTKAGYKKLQEAAKSAQSNSLIPKKTREALGRLTQQYGKQQEMFGPRGGVTRGVRGDLSGDATRGLGVSTAVSAQPEGQAPAEGTQVSGPVRVGAPEPSAAQPTGGETAQPSSLEDLKALAHKQANAKDWNNYFDTLDKIASYRAGIERDVRKSPITAKPEQAEPTAAPEAVEPTPPMAEIAEPTNPEDYHKVAALLRSKSRDPEEAAARTYFGKPHEGFVPHLENMAHDTAFETGQFRQGAESTAEAAYFHGMNKDAAAKAINWVRKNLSPETNRVLDSVMHRRAKMARDVEVNDAARRRIDDVRTKAAKEETKAEKVFREETSNAERSILSAKNRKKIDENLKQDRETRAKERATKQNRQQAAFEDIMETLRRIKAEHDALNLPRDAVSSLSAPLHPGIARMLLGGNLQGALRALAGHAHPFVSKVASKFAQLAAGTKVVVTPNLKDASGKPVSGFFDPRTNTVHLDAETGMTPHVVLHEVGHALMSAELDNPASLLARHLNQLFDKVKDSLGTAYGATNVHEFAAEAWSNPEFAAKLQAIHPDGQPHTAWDRFARAVSNFFRRLVGLESKPLTSMFDEVDKVLNDIVSPAPAVRNAGSLYSYAGAKAAMGFADRIIDGSPIGTAGQKEAVSDAIERSTDFVKKGLLSLSPMHALTDMAKKYFGPLATKMNDLINQRNGFEKKLSRGVDPIVDIAKEAIRKFPKSQEAFDNIVSESTLSGVDPTKPRDTYIKDKDKLAKWDDLNARYKKLPAEWQKTYNSIRDGYGALFSEIKNAIRQRIEDTDVDPTIKKAVIDKLMTRLASKAVIDPYFALGRTGDKWLSYDLNGERYSSAFKTNWARNKYIQELNRMGATRIESYSKLSEMNYRNAPSGSFVSNVLDLMESNGMPEETIRSTLQLFISTLPETAMAKSFQYRKGILGHDKDAVGTFERKSRNMAHQIANMVYNPKITDTLERMERHAKMVGHGIKEGETDAFGNQVKANIPARDNAVERAYLDEFKNRTNYILNPTKHNWGGIMQSAAFTYTLGFNLSSAMVNLTNVPMIVAPYLKGKYGDSNVSGAIGAATRIFMGAPKFYTADILGGKEGDTRKMKAMPSILNYSVNSKNKREADIARHYAPLVAKGLDFGQLGASQAYDMLNTDTHAGVIQKANIMSGWALHHGERMSREVTLMAAYDLELKKLLKDGVDQATAQEQAATNAIHVTELTNGGIAAAAAPRISHSALGKMLFMYKRYGVSMYYMLGKTLNEALKGETKEVRRAAWGQLGGIYGMTALMAGVQGVPLYGALSMVANAFKDDDDDDFDTSTRKQLGELGYKGLLEYITNLSVAGRVSLSDMLMKDLKTGEEGTTFSQQMLQAFGGPVFGVADRIQRGMSKINEGHVERGVEDILPSFLSNTLKAARYAAKGTSTLYGDPISGDVSLFNVLAQALGFAPADYTRQLEMNAHLKGVDKYVTQTATKLRQRYAIAASVGDREEMRDSRQKLIELGAKHKGLGINAATVDESLQKSIKARAANAPQRKHGVTLSKKLMEEHQQDAEEWEGGEEW